ncbi:MAG: glycosyltransferase family 2 protein [Rhodoglobus sp.]
MAVSSDQILIIMPAYNEEASVGQVVREVRLAMPHAACLVVDDGSQDRTAHEASAAGATVLELPFNVGVGGAVRLGLRYARDNGYSRVVQLDADGQHNPENIGVLLSALDQVDLVIGARFAGVGEYAARGPRRWAMRLLAVIVSWVAKSPLTDTTSGFKALGPRSIAVLAEHYPAEYLGDTVEALVIVARSGCQIAQVPVAMRVRQGGVASQGLFTSFRHLARLFVAVVFALVRPPSAYAVRGKS